MFFFSYVVHSDVSQQSTERFVACLLRERTTVLGYFCIACLVPFVVDEQYVQHNSF